MKKFWAVWSPLAHTSLSKPTVTAITSLVGEVKTMIFSLDAKAKV